MQAQGTKTVHLPTEDAPSSITNKHAPHPKPHATWTHGLTRTDPHAQIPYPRAVWTDRLGSGSRNHEHHMACGCGCGLGTRETDSGIGSMYVHPLHTRHFEHKAQSRSRRHRHTAHNTQRRFKSTRDSDYAYLIYACIMHHISCTPYGVRGAVVRLRYKGRQTGGRWVG